MLQPLYTLAMSAGEPLIERAIERRLAAGKEPKARLEERRGQASRPRPEGRLIWCHAASVGEAQALMMLLARLADELPEAAFLVTTITISSSELVERRLSEIGLRGRVRHQFAPIDRPLWVDRFLDHWRPDAAIMVESELWPVMLHRISKRRIPAALVNARISAASFTRWRFGLGWARALLSAFTLVLAQSPTAAARFRALGADRVEVPGNLKYSAAPLADDPPARIALETAIGARPVWLFASTHQGEESLIAPAHRALARTERRMLTIVAPRHPERGPPLAAALAQEGLVVHRRGAEGTLPDASTEVYVVDTIGELGIFYRISPIAVLGGSFVAVGGHNPIEPAQLGSALLVGPHTHNFDEVMEHFRSQDAVETLPDGAMIGPSVAALLREPGRARALADHALQTVADRAGVLPATLALLLPMLREALEAAD